MIEQKLIKPKLILPALLLTWAFSVYAETKPVPIACNLNALTAGERKQLHRYSEQLVSSVVGSRVLAACRRSVTDQV